MKKKNSTPTPHDAAFRQFLAQPEIARDFMELHLPAELRAICDLSTLKLESGSFVEDDLRQYFSDVLYSLETAVLPDVTVDLPAISVGRIIADDEYSFRASAHQFHDHRPL